MKRFILPAVVLFVFGLLVYFMTGNRADAGAAKKAPGATKTGQASCAGCHADFASVLPKGHPAVKGNTLAACAPCHEPKLTGKPEKNLYSARMHLGHLPPKGKLDCKACHTWTPGKSFGLIGIKGSWGAPTKEDMKAMREIFESWASSNFMDNLHAKAGIVCAGCHGKNLPKLDDTVENPRCIACHPMDKLVEKTAPKDFPDRNPHKSHLGDIACTVCHKAHSASKTYCLDCHRNFEMKKIPGS